MELFAANLSNKVSLKDIREVFEAFGRVVDVILVRRRLTDLSGGVAFVEMEVNGEGTAAILELNCFVLMGKAMVVSEVRTSPAVRTTHLGDSTKRREFVEGRPRRTVPKMG
ncbi:MAG: RNA recognition motif domain-containing protein [Planctomycetota bacterium]|jgi:RNA recognition motif-containing protein